MPSSWIRDTTRARIYKRDHYRCVYCDCEVVVGGSESNKRSATLDHVTPKDQGGTNCHDNIVTACLSCNSSKRHMSVRFWLRSIGKREDDLAKVLHRVGLAVKRKLPTVSVVYNDRALDPARR